MAVQLWLAALKALSAFLVYFGIRKAGADAQQAKVVKETLEKVVRADEVREKIAADAAAGVREHWLSKFDR